MMTDCPLFPEIGINLQHIKDKSLTVLNPFHSFSASHQRDMHLMDDADLAGPLLFCFALGVTLLLVSLGRCALRKQHHDCCSDVFPSRSQSGKSQFGYIYGVALMGDIAIYLLLNMMSEGGIDAYRVSSVLGYCILPLCLLSAISIVVRLE